MLLMLTRYSFMTRLVFSSDSPWFTSSEVSGLGLETASVGAWPAENASFHAAVHRDECTRTFMTELMLQWILLAPCRDREHLRSTSAR